ncbi:hypothetical protein HMPREF9108_01773 [Leptotrichia sp. oral taxon 225 str. F0581]|nr:hypothetical protein HMPREF9108_01773 [Leptotrichia sp. oral taxon 225 str. F0581]
MKIVVKLLKKQWIDYRYSIKIYSSFKLELLYLKFKLKILFDFF